MNNHASHRILLPLTDPRRQGIEPRNWLYLAIGTLRRYLNLLRSIRFHNVPELVEWVVIKTHLSREFGLNA